jgi:hypothetical protein
MGFILFVLAMNRVEWRRCGFILARVGILCNPIAEFVFRLDRAAKEPSVPSENQILGQFEEIELTRNEIVTRSVSEGCICGLAYASGYDVETQTDPLRKIKVSCFRLISLGYNGWFAVRVASGGPMALFFQGA